MRYKVILCILTCYCPFLLQSQDITVLTTVLRQLKEVEVDEAIYICQQEYPRYEASLSEKEQLQFAQLCHDYGGKLYATTQYIEAKVLYKTALSIRKNYLSRDDNDYLRTTYMYGNTLYKNQELDGARTYLEHTIEYAKAGSDALKKILTNYSYQELATVLIDIGEYENALNYLEEAEKYGPIREYLKGIIYIELQDYEAAIRLLKQNLANAQGVEFANIANNLGMAYHAIKNYEAAKRQYIAARKIEDLHDEILYNIYSNEVINYTRLGDLEAAEQAFKKGLVLAQKSQDELVISELYLHRASLLIVQQAPELALECYDEAIYTLVPKGYLNNPYSINTNLHHLIISKNKLIDALYLKAKALEVSTTKPIILYRLYQSLDTLITDTRIGYQSKAAKFMRIAKAVPIYEAAIQAAINYYEDKKDVRILEQALHFAARNTAAMHYEDIRQRQLLRSQYPDWETKERRLKKRIHTLEKELAEGQTNKTTDLFNERLQYKQFIKQLKKTASSYYDVKYAFSDLPTVEEIQLQMPNNMAILKYFVGQNHIFLFVVTKSGRLRYYDLPKEDHIQRNIENLISGDKNTPPMEDVAVPLYNSLLSAAFAQLPKKVNRLRIIPDDFLLHLPFEALKTKSYKAREYLVHHYAISYAISNKEHQFKREYQATKEYIGIGTDYDCCWANLMLPNIIKPPTYLANPILELEHSELYFREAIVLFNEIASKANFLKQAKDYRIQHLAFHSVLDTTNALSSSILFDNRLSSRKEDWLLELSELYSMASLHSNLTILSACDTGNGTFRKGEGLMSLARAFQYAGAESVVASLWAASDRAASNMIVNFNKHLSEEYPIDIALQQAKINYLANASTAVSYPYYWANFVLIGNPEKIDN